MREPPADRLRDENDRPIRPDGDFVLYWMVAARRTRASFALDRALAWAARLKRPLVVLEALRCDYPYASDRLHRFILEGMAQNAEALEDAPLLYHPYVETERGAGKGLLAALSERACVVITDRFPAFFFPRMLAAAASKVAVRLESVDGSGLLPLSATEKAFARAHDFRRHLRRVLPEHLGHRPKARPFAGVSLPRMARLPRAIRARWPAASPALLAGRGLDRLPLDHSVAPASLRGGMDPARAALRRFLDRGLFAYAAEQRHPDAEATSGLSPYLHFGHIGAHEILEAVLEKAGASAEDAGAGEGFFGLDEGPEAFLDQLITWRELGYNFCAHRDDADSYDGLPDWARETLARHRRDRRAHHYDLETLAEARTDDPLWNAAQRELLVTGRIHNYLRMLWGKRVLEWTRDPEEAFDLLVHLNDTYALDGRDPNSYNGIGWCFGRYDRPWPERPIFGKVRYMTSASTRRKLRLNRWLARYGETSPPFAT
jgi:deoxyribodipyrimidine photo-lyase